MRTARLGRGPPALPCPVAGTVDPHAAAPLRLSRAVPPAPPGVSSAGRKGETRSLLAWRARLHCLPSLPQARAPAGSEGRGRLRNPQAQGGFSPDNHPPFSLWPELQAMLLLFFKPRLTTRPLCPSPPVSLHL